MKRSQIAFAGWPLAGLCTALALMATALVPTHAHAQSPTPVFPSVLDIHQVKLGTWAEYAMTMANGQMKQRMAVVGRDENNTTIEMTVEGGPTAAMGPVLMQLMVPRDPKQAGKPAGVVLQLGKNQPMQMPIDHPMAPKESFHQLDAKELKGKAETIKVPAGSFSAKRYSQTHGGQEAVTWLSEKVPPLGMVKMESKTQMGPVKVELVKQGQDAKSLLNGKPVPFDQNLFMQQAMAGMSGGPGGPSGAKGGAKK